MAHTQTSEGKRIPLGSGSVYCMAYTGSIPADNVIETEENRLGHIKGGASLTYTPTYYTAKDDLNKVAKTILTEEEAKLGLGLITWNANVLNKLCANGSVSETAATQSAPGKRTLKIGGIENQNVVNYLFRFVNTDPVDGDIRITVVGNNQAGITMTWAKDAETVLNPEIVAQPMADGTLIIFEEEVITANTP